jgi:uncharacterized protein (TIGR00730 family)
MMPGFAESARALGRLCAVSGIGIVYGGASIGLMGLVADAALDAGGEVIGVMPQALADLEIAHPGLSKLHIVVDMHERKAMMSSLADGFVALPGGLGTFEELLEITTWRILGIHEKPCIILNTDGYFQPLFAMLDKTVAMGFMKAASRDVLESFDSPDSLIESFLGRLPQ